MSDAVVQVYGMDWNGWMPGWGDKRAPYIANKTIKDGDIAPWKDQKRFEQR